MISLIAAALAMTQAPEPPAPIIDMHMHTSSIADFAPGMRYCLPLMEMEPPLDHSRPVGEQMMAAWMAPDCDEPLVAPATDEEILRLTIERLEANNAIALLQGPPERVRRWMAAAPGRFLPSVQFTIGREDHEDIEWLRDVFTDGGFMMLGEVGNQYAGITPNDPRMDDVWALMAELDIPVGYHSGTGPPGAHAFFPKFRVSVGNPTHFEDVFHRHPDLRISIQHMASGFHDELKMMMWTYPTLYVELSGPITWSNDFHAYLKDLIDAGFENRILFGVDALVWPDMLDHARTTIEEADYLTEEQKRKILFENAVRFLKLDRDEVLARATG